MDSQNWKTTKNISINWENQIYNDSLDSLWYDKKPIKFNLPDSIDTIKKLCNLIKQNPGEIKIKLWNLECKISEKCLKEIKKICWK